MQAGVVQRVIAESTGQSQNEVCEILKGRQVMAYDVLERIATGLDVPREAMGLGYGAYAEGTASEPGQEADERTCCEDSFSTCSRWQALPRSAPPCLGWAS